MASKDEKSEIVLRVTEQRVDIPPSANEVRKGVNVLNTSDPKSPAPNPFVQNQNQNTVQGAEQPNTGNQGKSKDSE